MGFVKAEGGLDFTVDINTIMTNVISSSGTFGDFMFSLASTLKSQFCSGISKTVIGNYPAIKLPNYEGEVGDDCIYLVLGNQTDAGTASKTNLQFYLRGDTEENITAIHYVFSDGTYQVANTEMLMNPASYGMRFRISIHDDGYNIAIVKSGSHVPNMPFFVTYMEDNDEEKHNAIFICSVTSSQPSLQLYIYDEVWKKFKDIYRLHTILAQRTGVGQVERIDTGDYRNPNYFLYSRYNTSLYGQWDTDNTLLGESGRTDDLWYENAFSLGGESFDAWICCALNTSYQYPTVCRKSN